ANQIEDERDALRAQVEGVRVKCREIVDDDRYHPFFIMTATTILSALDAPAPRTSLTTGQCINCNAELGVKSGESIPHWWGGPGLAVDGSVGPFCERCANMIRHHEHGHATAHPSAANDAAALLTVAGWRDIATAPKDGTKVLGYHEEGVDICWFDEPDPD